MTPGFKAMPFRKNVLLCLGNTRTSYGSIRFVELSKNPKSKKIQRRNSLLRAEEVAIRNLYIPVKIKKLDRFSLAYRYSVIETNRTND